MLKVIEKLDGLDIRQLMQVYQETNRKYGSVTYKNLPENLQILYAEQDFYAYLELFFSSKDSVYAVWAPDGVYKAALRVERYDDGLIITGLETAPDMRQRGYATLLLESVINYLGESNSPKLYSHIEKKNNVSLRLHENIGFQKISDSAIYIDGSLHRDAYTLCLNLK